jgi:DNA-binding MarR family transcriptional regulator
MDLRTKLSMTIGHIFKMKGECYLNLIDDLNIDELSIKQVRYLKLLDKSCGMTTSQLAEMLNLSKPSVTEMVKKFTKYGYVFKQSCPADGRVYYLKLTEKGQQIVDIDSMTYEYLANRLINELETHDIETLIGILEKLA